MTIDICILLGLHFVADFLLQPDWMAKQKSERFLVLLAHSAIQAAVVTLGALVIMDAASAVRFGLVNAIIHGAIDWNIWRGYKLSVRMRDKTATKESWRYWEDHWFYVTIGFDQLLHGITLVALYGAMS